MTSDADPTAATRSDGAQTPRSVFLGPGASASSLTPRGHLASVARLSVLSPGGRTIWTCAGRVSFHGPAPPRPTPGGLFGVGTHRRREIRFVARPRAAGSLRGLHTTPAPPRAQVWRRSGPVFSKSSSMRYSDYEDSLDLESGSARRRRTALGSRGVLLRLWPCVRPERGTGRAVVSRL